MCRLLVGGLGTWRDGALRAGWNEICAVADGEYALVARRLQGWRNNELAGSAGLEPIEVAQHSRTLHAGRPDHQLGRNEVAAGERHAVRTHLGHARACAHIDTEAR